MRGVHEPSELAVRLVELLDGGGWVEREKVIRKAGKVIPPGRAIRQTERARRKAGGTLARPNKSPERIRPASDERQIQVGRRSLVVASLYTWRRDGYLEERTDDEGVKWVRLTSLPPAVAQHREQHPPAAPPDLPLRVRAEWVDPEADWHTP